MVQGVRGIKKESLEISAVPPVKTGVQSVLKALKTLDSGFRRNDVKKKQIDFFTPSPLEGEGKNLGFRMETIYQGESVSKIFDSLFGGKLE